MDDLSQRTSVGEVLIVKFTKENKKVGKRKERTKKKKKKKNSN